MKSVFLILLIAIPGFFLQEFTPWWSIALWTLLLGFFLELPPSRCFWYGFAGGFTLWLLLALWMFLGNGGILANRMGQMFHVGNGYSMLAITALIGGLLGGFGMLTGRLGRKLFT